MAMDSNEDYYSGDFGEQINRSNAMDDDEDMMNDEKKSTEDETRPMPNSSEAETAFQERLSTQRSDRDDADELEGRDIRE